ncbi:hypothetical protein O181_001361 [Austropuccinia psidii MF-1]|uniref:Uncharacterized protein n=1 Tax=Austropuccinia psidii MF-1 TaxID=1389203 RepID=A0A9Q3BAU8_9BASI|nr:hypothetical protein [Austropuccinia psidii MF-1]
MRTGLLWQQEGVGNSSPLVDKHNEILTSSKEVLGPRKNSRPSDGYDAYVFQRTSPKDKNLFEKQKHFVRGPEERVGPKERKQLCKAPQASKSQNWP